MNEQINYIRSLATEYENIRSGYEQLYGALRRLGEPELSEILTEYRGSGFGQPVNLLRAESARLLLAGELLDHDRVELIKDRIRERDREYFSDIETDDSKPGNADLNSARDAFYARSDDWSIFHTFFYRSKVKETVQLYLEQIGTDLVERLGLPDYGFEWVDFHGGSSFGDVRFCSVNIFPQRSASSTRAYRLFVRIGSELSGSVGSPGKSPANINSIAVVNDFEELIGELSRRKDDVVAANDALRGYYKCSPGKNAGEWAVFQQENIIALDYGDLNVGDISSVRTYTELLQLGSETNLSHASGGLWNLWLFKSAKRGDVVFANRGRSICLGIGVIAGDYYYDPDARNGFKHRRKVSWLTNQAYEHKPSPRERSSTLFRADSFSPTLKEAYILSEYLRLYPKLRSVFSSYDLPPETKPEPEHVNSSSGVADDLDVQQDRPVSYWWLNANPKIWSIADFAEGQRQTYTARNEKGNKRRIYKHFEAVQPGDQVIGYESSPSRQVKAIFEVTKGLHSTSDGEVIEIELVEKLEIPVFWNELQSNPSLAGCEPFINNQGSLFKLEEEEFDIIREAIDERNIGGGGKLAPAYSFRDDPDKPFIVEDEFMRTVELLRRKKNIILQGAPGVGKTFIARKIAYQLMGAKDDAQIEMVQFHQSYSYEDFIQGLRPARGGGFELRNGVFYTFCRQAQAHPERKFFMIIDEINRGNLSKIFGEMMMLIEADKRNEKYALKLTYAEDEADRFYVPENLYIIGTMNTADRSLAMVDYALRRRFAFINLRPEFGEKFVAYLSGLGVSTGAIDDLCRAIERVNGEIRADQNLGGGFEIGHSYFCGKPDDADELEWLRDIIAFEIRPLLEEIWFDDASKVEKMMEHLAL